MQNVAVIGCGAYMNSGYGCPGEWRCLKAAALARQDNDLAFDTAQSGFQLPAVSIRLPAFAGLLRRRCALVLIA